MLQSKSPVSSSLTLWCALSIGSLSLPAAEEVDLKSEAPIPATRTDSSPSVNSDETRALLDGLDSETPETRMKARRIVEADAERLIPALISETSFGRGSVEVRLTLNEIARSRNLEIQRPERLRFDSVHWALENLHTEEASIRIAVAEILRRNPLIHAEPKTLTLLKADHDGRIFISLMEKQTRERPHETITFLRQLPESELSTFLGGDSGPALLKESVINTLTSFTGKSLYLSESQQVSLLGGRDAELDAFIGKIVESSSDRRDIQEVLHVVAKAGRAGSCAERLSALGIQYAKEGFVLLRYATIDDTEKRSTVERIISGIARHYHDLCPSDKGIDELLASEDPSPIISGVYGNAGWLWHIALNEAEYSSWVSPLGFSTKTLVHPAAFDAPALSQRDLEVRFWQAAIIGTVSPDGKSPQCSLLTSVLPRALQNISEYPPNSYDGWKFEYLPLWVEVLVALDKQNLPPDLVPTSHITDSLPPHHAPGRGTPLGALQTYSQIVQVVHQGRSLTAQSHKVLRRTLDKLSSHEYRWIAEGPERATRLITSLEETARGLEAQGKNPEEVASELDSLLEKELPSVMASGKEAEERVEQLDEPARDIPGPLESLQGVLEYLESPQGRFTP